MRVCVCVFVLCVWVCVCGLPDPRSSSPVLQLWREGVLKNVVPVCVSLKHILERLRSPVLRHLLAYLQFLFHHYGSDMQDLLASNRLLARELQFDMEQLKERGGRRPRHGQLLDSPDLRMDVDGAAPPHTPSRTPRSARKFATPPPMPLDLTPSTAGGSSTQQRRRQQQEQQQRGLRSGSTPQVLPRIARRSPLKVCLFSRSSG